MLTIVGRAFALLAQRWPLYLIAATTTIALEASVVVLWHVPVALEFANDAITPILVTLVYAFVAADMREVREGNAAISARALERVWAVIVIDFLVTILFENGLGYLSIATIPGSLGGTLLLFFAAMLIFADVSATIDDTASLILLIPNAIARSIVTAVQRRMFYRVLILFTAQFVVGFVANAIYAGLHAAHLAHPMLWSIVPVTAIASVPFAAVTVVLYRTA